MANHKVGTIWKSGVGTVIPTPLLKCDATSLPVLHDLVIMGSDGEVEFAVDTAGSSTIAAMTLLGICVQGLGSLYLNNPGYQAATANELAIAQFGGVGSRAATLSPTNQRHIGLFRPGDQFVISRNADTAVVIGQTYGIDRIAAGDYVLDTADTQDAIRVLGYYSPDIEAGIPVSGGGGAVARVWVEPVYIYNGPIIAS